MRVSIVDEICKNLKKLPEERAFSSSTSLYPSEASIKTTVDGEEITLGTCIRKSWYRVMEFPKEERITPDHYLILTQGNQECDRLITLLDRLAQFSGLHIWNCAELPIHDKKLNVRGRVDFPLVKVPENIIYPVEVKSVGDWKTRMTINKPADQHLLQLLYYMRFLKDHAKEMFPGYTVGGGLLVYISRTDNYLVKKNAHGSPIQKIWEYYVTEDDGVKVEGHNETLDYSWLNSNLIIERWEQLNDYIANKILPPADYKPHYTEEEVLGLYRSDKLVYKYQKDAVKKWEKKGFPPGGLELTMEHPECRFCDYQKFCISNQNTHKEDEVTLI